MGAAKVGQHAKIWKETAKGRPSTAEHGSNSVDVQPAPIGVWKDAAAPGAGEAVPAVAAAPDGANAASASCFSVMRKMMGVGAS